MDDWGKDDTQIRADWGTDDHVLTPGTWGHGDEVVKSQAVDPREVRMNAARTDNRSFLTKLGEGFGTGDQWNDAAKTAGTEMRISGHAIPVLGSQVEQTPEMTQYEKDHPGRALVSKGIGMATTLPAIAAAPEAFGAGAGQSLLTRAGLGALTNGGLSGADTLARTHDLKEAGKDAFASALVGGAPPLVGSAVKAVSPYAGAFYRNMTSANTMHIPGGWIPESVLAYGTGGLSEIPFGAYRMAKGVGSTIKEMRSPGTQFQYDLFKQGVAKPDAERLMAGAMARNQLAQALTGGQQ